MAVLTLNTYSTKLKMNTLITMIIPDSSKLAEPLANRKVLWLLHGLSDDATTWLRKTRIETYADEYGIVVIMPSFDRSFYSDNVNGQNYFTYLTSELPEYFEKVFLLSRKKEDNFIAGLSMGGYGAMKAALTFPNQYFSVGSFSGVLALDAILQITPSDAETEFPFLIKEIENLKTSKINPPNLLSKEKDLLIYASCGLQDYLLEATTLFEKRAKELDIEAKFIYRDGIHDWYFWDQEIKEYLRFAL